MALCLMLDYATGLSWIDDVSESEYPPVLEDGGGFMAWLPPGLDPYNQQVFLQSLKSIIDAEMRMPGSQHKAIKNACYDAKDPDNDI